MALYCPECVSDRPMRRHCVRCSWWDCLTRTCKVTRWDFRSGYRKVLAADGERVERFNLTRYRPEESP